VTIAIEMITLVRPFNQAVAEELSGLIAMLPRRSAAPQGMTKTSAAEIPTAVGQLRRSSRRRPRVLHSFFRWPCGVRKAVIRPRASSGDTMVSSCTTIACGSASANPTIRTVTRPTYAAASFYGRLVGVAGAEAGAPGITVVVMARVLTGGVRATSGGRPQATGLET